MNNISRFKKKTNELSVIYNTTSKLIHKRVKQI